MNEEPLLGEHVPYVRMSRQIRDLQRQLVGLPQVVGIEERDELAIGRVDTAVSRRRRSLSLLFDETHSCKRGGDRCGRIARAVIHYDDLEVAVTLRQHTSKRLGEKTLGVVGRNNHADESLSLAIHWDQRRFFSPFAQASEELLDDVRNMLALGAGLQPETG